MLARLGTPGTAVLVQILRQVDLAGSLLRWGPSQVESFQVKQPIPRF